MPILPLIGLLNGWGLRYIQWLSQTLAYYSNANFISDLDAISRNPTDGTLVPLATRRGHAPDVRTCSFSSTEPAKQLAG